MATISNNPALRFYLLAAFAMAYGWGYRGTVGHEAGAMVPGALLALVLCLGSGRPDWQRRSAVAGLFGAIGWAWGGSLSYMEQTFYTLSGSFPDVLFGYSMLFLLGGLWAGIGGGALGLALTEPRSELERLIRPFTWICAAFLASYLYLSFLPSQKEAYETFSVRHFHGGEWLSATLTVLVSGLCWLWSKRDRAAAALYFRAGIAWWAGYLALTKFGGLRLGPLHRSESWGGLAFVLIVFALYLKERRNRAALMLCLYGVLGGGLAFALAVFLRHPLAIHWGPFQGGWPQWRFAEVCFGFFMALAIALGAGRLIRGGLASPEEDTSRTPLDVYAAFVVLVAIQWVNFRRHAAPRLSLPGASDLAGLPAWVWVVFLGLLATLPVLYFLDRYAKGDRRLAPQSSFGKGALMALFVLWVTVAGYTQHDAAGGTHIDGFLLLWVPAAVASLLLLSCPPGSLSNEVAVARSDPQWAVGRQYWLLWGLTPVLLLALSGISIAMQGGPVPGMGRKRFGPDAYWRQAARMVGAWKAIGKVRRLEDAVVPSEDLPLRRLEFTEARDVIATLPSGQVDDSHLWFRKNQYFWLRWNGRKAAASGRAEIPLEFRGQHLYVAWPPEQPGAEGYLVWERVE